MKDNTDEIEFLKYNLNGFNSNPRFRISVRPDKGLIAIIISDKTNEKILSKITLKRNDFAQLCYEFSFALVKYLEQEQKP